MRYGVSVAGPVMSGYQVDKHRFSGSTGLRVGGGGPQHRAPGRQACPQWRGGPRMFPGGRLPSHTPLWVVWDLGKCPDGAKGRAHQVTVRAQLPRALGCPLPHMPGSRGATLGPA